MYINSINNFRPQTFTGIKNTSYEHIWDNECNSEIFVLNTQFTDDREGNDLSDYKNMLNKAHDRTNQGYNNTINPQAMNVTFIRTPNTARGYVEYQLFLNGKEFDRNDQNLHMFDFIAKFAKKLINKPEKDFIINNDYVNGDEVRYSIIMNTDLKKIMENCGYGDYEKHIQEMHDPKFVKIGAKAFQSSLDEIMTDYFA